MNVKVILSKEGQTPKGAKVKEEKSYVPPNAPYVPPNAQKNVAYVPPNAPYVQENVASVSYEPSENIDVKAIVQRPTKKYNEIDKEKIRTENEQLKLQLYCMVCKVDRVQTLNLPCRHLVCCDPCNNNLDNCYYCNATILGTVRTYLG